MRLGDALISVSNGISKKQNRNDEGIPVTRIETISAENINLNKVGYLAGLSKSEITKYRLKSGDILFSNINSDSHLGKTAIYNYTDHVLLHGMNLLLLRPNTDIITPEYLNYLCKFYRIQGKFVSIAQHAVNQSSINQTKLKNIEIPLAPLPEQARIVSKIEELFTKLDAGIDAIKKAKLLLKKYRQAVLKAAMDGRPTKDWRKAHKSELEPASELLDRIKEQRKKGLGAKYKEPPVIDTSELPDLPEGWVWATIGQVIGPTNEKIEPSKTQEIAYLGLEHIDKNNGKIISMGSSKTVKSTKNKFYKGDLLYGKLRPYLNKLYIAEFDGMCSTDIMVFSPNKNYSIRYFLYRFLSMDFVRFASMNMTGVQHPRIDYDMLSKYLIALPPLLEQEKIIDIVSRLFSNIDILEDSIKKELSKTGTLKNSILKRAFEGKLVPQNQSDEPAKKLLERIESESKLSKVRKEAGKMRKAK